jgi:hypothetical protein
LEYALTARKDIYEMADPIKELVENKEFVQTQSVRLLDAQERAQCARLATGEPPHSQRAQVLLALDQGETQKDAAQLAGLSPGQVRYWLGKFRQDRMAIFPEDVLVVLQPTEDSSAAPRVSSDTAESAADSQVEAVEQSTEKGSKKKAMKDKGKKGKSKKGKGKKDKRKKGKKKAKPSAGGKKSTKKKKK